MRHGSRLRNPKPGEVVAAGLLATGLSASAVLVALGHDPVSTCVRSSWPLRITALVIFTHMVFRIPHDPLTWVGRRLSPAPRR